MPSSPSASLSPSVVGAAIRLRRLVILVVVICALIALIYTAVTGSTYTAKAQLVIAQPPTFLPPFPVSGSHETAASYVNQQVAILQSQAVSDDAAGIVNSKVTGADVTGDQIHAGLTIKPQTGAAAGVNNTTQVLVTLPTAELAAAGSNAVVAAYITALHTQIRNQANSSIAALDREIDTVNNQLNNVPAPTTGTKGQGATSVTTPSKSVTTVVKPPKTTTTRVPRATTTRPPRTTTTHPARTTTTKATTTTTSKTTTSALGGPQTLGPMQLTAFRQTSTTSTTTASTTTSTSSSSSSSGSSGSSSSVLSTQNQRVPLLATLTNLTRSRSQVRVDEEADLAYTPTVFPATIPSSTSNGNFLRNFVIGVLVGLLIGVIAAYAIAARRRQFERAPEPELLYGVPLISAVPAFQINPWLPIGLPIVTDPADEPAEQIRVIATALRSIRNSHESLVIAFSSAGPRSGTTTIVANTGIALANMEERVLVVDGDPIGRGLTRILTETEHENPIVAPRPGFSEVVGGRPLMDTVTPSDVAPGLSVLTSGADPNLAMHRWSAQAIRLALQDAADHYDMVLIDVPPIGSSSYGMDLADAAENLIMVIPYLDLVELHELLKERMRVADLKMLGYVFNGASSRNHFMPYYPVLYDSREAVSLGAARERALPVQSMPSPREASSTAATPPAAQAAAEDITGVTTAVRPDEPVTETIPAVDEETGQVTKVDPE